MSTYTDEQLQQLIPFMEKLAEYNCGYDLSKALMVEVLHLRNLLRGCGLWRHTERLVCDLPTVRWHLRL